LLAGTFDKMIPNDPDFFTTVTFEFGQKVSLSWYLTEKEKNDISTEAKKLAEGDELPALVKWWKDRPEKAKAKEAAKQATARSDAKS
jgi:hypothetical protein